jgi:DNA-binding response OmpR family regulator
MTRILIVDEDNDVLRLLRVKLGAAGYQTSLARDGKEALDLAESENPNIVVMELRLPDVDGLALLSKIKKAVKPVPLTLILSQESAAQQINAAFEAGADDYLSKPFSPQVLLERLRVNLIRNGFAVNDQER